MHQIQLIKCVSFSMTKFGISFGLSRSKFLRLSMSPYTRRFESTMAMHAHTHTNPVLNGFKIHTKRFCGSPIRFDDAIHYSYSPCIFYYTWQFNNINFPINSYAHTHIKNGNVALPQPTYHHRHTARIQLQCYGIFFYLIFQIQRVDY